LEAIKQGYGWNSFCSINALDYFQQVKEGLLLGDDKALSGGFCRLLKMIG
jgi:hypothetical protein